MASGFTRAYHKQVEACVRTTTRAVFCLSYTTIVNKVVPFGESCPGTHTGYRIFLSHGDFASRSAGFLGSIFIIILLK
jgi:hypothetical protein